MLLCRLIRPTNICKHFRFALGLDSYICRCHSKDVANISSSQDVLDNYCDSFFIQNSDKIIKNSTYTSQIHAVSPESKKHYNNLQSLFRKLNDEEILLEIDQMARSKRPKDAVILLKFCEEKHIIPPSTFLLYMLKLFAKVGEKEGLMLVIAKLKTLNREVYERENGFRHYIALSTWMQGNFRDSIEMFMDLFKIEKCFKPAEKVVLQSIISDSIANRGEAPLFVMKEFVENVSCNYGDYYPMVMFWQYLFESEWFADQQLANELLKNNKNLINFLHWKIPIWSSRLLKVHKTDVVFRLCQVLLKYDYHDCYSSVLHNLFDYYYIRGDLKMCSTIVKNALDLNITLRESQQKRFLILLTKGKPDSITDSSGKCSKIKINLNFYQGSFFNN